MKERGRPEVIIEAGKVGPLRIASRQHGLEVSVVFVELGCRTTFLAVDELGMKVAIVNSSSGHPIGSVCVQTAIDTQGDARLVVKIGNVKFGSLVAKEESSTSMLANDFLRFRVRWTEFTVTLDEVRGRSQETMSTTKQPTFYGELRSHLRSRLNVAEEESNSPSRFKQPVVTIIFSRFTVDYQRIFKESSPSRLEPQKSSERAQLSVIIQDMQIKDETPGSSFPVVFDSSSQLSFLDLCIRLRGPSNADIVKVDLVDLNLCHANGKSDKIILKTSEDFIWKLFDLTNRILAASGELAGFTLKLEEDEEHGGFIVKMEESDEEHLDVQYTVPKTDKLYDIALARVSPFAVVVSFQRNPQASRYKKLQNVRGANLMNYFTQRLKFTIDRAELNFARYEKKSLKGPPDRLLESLYAVYLSRMKFKLVTLITAASIQDWKYLAARDVGDDEFVEGDILRVTGTLAGRTAGRIFKKVGQGIGDGVSGLSHAIGDGIESTTDKIGVGKFGAGVNCVVSGVGDGFGQSIAGGK